jgi:signal recognition particle receptor subunit beta
MVFANKQDLPNALSASELTDRLKLREVKRKVSLKSVDIAWDWSNIQLLEGSRE